MNSTAEVRDIWIAARGVSLRLRTYPAAGQAHASAVVLHGLGTGVDVLREARPGVDPYAALAGEGLDVVALDWPGHGRSGGRRGHLTYRLAMDAVAAAVGAALERSDRPVGLIGTALGGALAFYAALEDRRVRAVACHNVLDLRDVRPVLQRARQKALLPVAARLARRLDEGGRRAVRIPTTLLVAEADLADDPGTARRLRRHDQAVRSYDLDGLAALLLEPTDKPDIAAQRVPTLLAVGAEDRVLPVTHTRAIASRLTIDHELWVLPGAGHQLLLEHAAETVPKLAAWIRDHA